MITLPRRSVTRFFIPMIDVLTLLFCIFLLMPIIRENEFLSDEGINNVTVASDLQKEIEARQKRLQELHDAEHRAQIALAQLEKKPGEFVRKNFFYRTLYISPRDGTLSYYDPTNPGQAPFKIASKEDARKLIKKNREEAGDRTLFYKFERLYDPSIKEPAFPRGKQMERYLDWFRDVVTEGYVTSPGEDR